MHKQQIADGIYMYWKQKSANPIESVLDTFSRSSTAVLDSSMEVEVEHAEFTVHFLNNTAFIKHGTNTETYDLSKGKREFKSEFCSDSILED